MFHHEIHDICDNNLKDSSDIFVMPSYLVKCFRIKHEKININTSAKDDDDIFLTQSTFDAQAEVDFDIDVDQMIMFESPKKTDDPAEPTRPKRNSQKDRRNSLYEYFSIVKKH